MGVFSGKSKSWEALAEATLQILIDNTGDRNRGGGGAAISMPLKRKRDTGKLGFCGRPAYLLLDSSDFSSFPWRLPKANTFCGWALLAELSVTNCF